MPTYVYKCSKCGHAREVRHGFSEKGPKTCSRNGCRGKLERVFTAPAIIFKGKGFYVTDYGRGNGKRKPRGDNGDGSEKASEKVEKTAEKTVEKSD
jgi:putative FmdB family regulatory protein